MLYEYKLYNWYLTIWYQNFISLWQPKTQNDYKFIQIIKKCIGTKSMSNI